MEPRERVLATLRFEPVDRPAYDLIEGMLWPELEVYFQERYGLADPRQIIEFLDPDLRWVSLRYQGPPRQATVGGAVYSKAVASGPLAEVARVEEVAAYPLPDPAWWQPPDCAAARRQWPRHALALLAWQPLFLTACDLFGMEGALVKLMTAPELFDALVARKHAANMDILARSLPAAQGVCDICWLGDDFAGQQALLMRPELWRRHIKPRLAEEVRLARAYGLAVMYHSCGAVAAVLPDLIEIGVNGLGVFQTTAAGMDAETIAAAFGGRLAFYGGIDVQGLLSTGTAAAVTAEVRRNVRAFARCGGYIVANAHRIATIKGDNLVAMCRAAASCTLSEELTWH